MRKQSLQLKFISKPRAIRSTSSGIEKFKKRWNDCISIGTDCADEKNFAKQMLFSLSVPELIEQCVTFIFNIHVKLVKPW